MSIDVPVEHFNVAVAYYSPFHIPREEHLELFRCIYGWLKSGGYLLTMFNRFSQEAYTEDEPSV